MGRRRGVWNDTLGAMLTTPMQMLLLAIAGWLNQEQREKIEFLQEQVRLLQELHAIKVSAIALSRAFQNESQAGSSGASGSADSSIITIEKRHDRSIE